MEGGKKGRGGGVMGLVNIEDSRSIKSGLYKAMEHYCS